MRTLLLLALAVALTSPASADPASLQPGLAGIGFLAGSWSSGDGRVADTGETSRGTSDVTPEAAGSVLLRRDHTELVGPDGKPAGQFDQIMMIYPDGGTLHADYADGDHVIHYTSAVVVPGHAVAFSTATIPGAPAFRLTSVLTSAATLSVTFEMAPPGQTAFRPIASGTLHARERP